MTAHDTTTELPARPLGLVTVWVPAVCMMLVSVISYIDRNTLAILAPTILKETGLSKEEYGWIISAFSFAYMIGNPLWGRWLDRVGVRAGMLASVAFWTVASVSHAFATGFWSFAIARAALGFGEGATFPGGLRTAVLTLGVERRARGVAIAYSGGSLGAIVTPLIVAPIFAWWGWRAAFLFTGLIGAAWLVLWWFVSLRSDLRDESSAAPPTSPLPLGEGQGEGNCAAASPPPAAPVAQPLEFTDPRVWSFMAVYALGALPIAFVLYSSSIYLDLKLRIPQVTINKLLWIPPLGWELGYFFWGWVTDRTCRGASNPIAVQRRLFAVLTAASLPLALTPSLDRLSFVLASLFVAMFITAGFVIVAVSYATHVYSPSHSGLIAGLGAGSWGAAVAVAMPFFGRMFDQERFHVAFIVAAIIPVAGCVVWLAINRRAAAGTGTPARAG